MSSGTGTKQPKQLQILSMAHCNVYLSIYQEPTSKFTIDEMTGLNLIEISAVHVH